MPFRDSLRKRNGSERHLFTVDYCENPNVTFNRFVCVLIVPSAVEVSGSQRVRVFITHVVTIEITFHEFFDFNTTNVDKAGLFRFNKIINVLVFKDVSDDYASCDEYLYGPIQKDFLSMCLAFLFSVVINLTSHRTIRQTRCKQKISFSSRFL